MTGEGPVGNWGPTEPGVLGTVLSFLLDVVSVCPGLDYSDRSPCVQRMREITRDMLGVWYMPPQEILAADL